MTSAGWMARLKGTSAWDVFSLLTALRLPGAGYSVGIAALTALLFGMALQGRFFCQFLCPMGAFFAILPVLPFASLSRKPENCFKGCNACKNRCPAGLKLEPDGIRNGECIGCERCVPICPSNNLSYPALAIFKSGYTFILLRAAIFFALGCWLGFCRFVGHLPAM